MSEAIFMWDFYRSGCIFRVASNAIAQRTKELSIRRVLGAGALAAFIAVRVSASVIADLLFGLTATDAANLVAAVAVMILVALAACALPALRAARIDPLAGFREE
jgi:putative ABC transport system permease protein